MPSATLPSPFEVQSHLEPNTNHATARQLGEPVRRRGNLAQGQALETLGHAVEYLIDSRVWQGGSYDAADYQEAVQILMRSSRAVFAECPEVRSLRRRLQQWVHGRGR